MTDIIIDTIFITLIIYNILVYYGYKDRVCLYFKKEYILCASTYFDDGIEHAHQPLNITTGFVMSGHNHAQIYGQFTKGLQLVSERRDVEIYEMESGFLTSTNRFVNRRDAIDIAKKCRQLDKKFNGNQLYSEDLWNKN